VLPGWKVQAVAAAEPTKDQAADISSVK